MTEALDYSDDCWVLYHLDEALDRIICRRGKSLSEESQRQVENLFQEFNDLDDDLQPPKARN